MDEIGLFPLGTVLVPSERLPLHIFEPRYRELIADCLARSVEFGLVYQDEGGQKTVGTRASVVEVMERFPDGRLNIMVAGGGRFRILEPTEGRSFLTAWVEDVPEADDPPSGEELAACMAAFDRILSLMGADDPAPDSVQGMASFAIAAYLGLPPDLKQELLELDSERLRILRITEALLGPAAAELEAQEITRRAGTNGKVDHL